MALLKPNPTLADIQAYVAQIEKERGFEHDSIQDKCILLGEELGELMKAIRTNHSTVKVDESSTVSEVAGELPDMLIVMCALANRLNIDLEDAFRQKEEVNSKRSWKYGFWGDRWGKYPQRGCAVVACSLQASAQ